MLRFSHFIHFWTWTFTKNIYMGGYMDKWMGRWLVGGCSDVNTLTLRLAEASKPFTEAEKNYSKITRVIF